MQGFFLHKKMEEKDFRINKYIAACGFCSRREADRLIAEGKVLVNGRIPDIGQKISDRDCVTVDGKNISRLQETVVYAYYKPVGVTVTREDAHAERTIYDDLSIPEAKTLKYAGRLDKASEGLLLLTSDGELIDYLMRGRNHHEKEYVVTLDAEPTKEDMQTLEKGVFLAELDRMTKPCKIHVSGKRSVTMVLTEGLNREIRRMWALLGYQVMKLKRIRVADVTVGDLKPGKYRKLLDEEVQMLRQEK